MSNEITSSLIEQVSERLPATAAYVMLYLWAKTQERGQNSMNTTYAKLCVALGIEKSGIRRALQRLARNEFIKFDSGKRCTEIHVHNIHQILLGGQQVTRTSNEVAPKPTQTSTDAEGSSPPHPPISISINSKTKFIKPSPLEVTVYGQEIGFKIDGEEFCDFYESKGWLIGKNTMKDWRAAVRTWKKKAEPTKLTIPRARPKPPETMPSPEELVQPSDIHDLVVKLAGGAKRIP